MALADLLSHPTPRPRSPRPVDHKGTIQRVWRSQAASGRSEARKRLGTIVYGSDDDTSNPSSSAFLREKPATERRPKAAPVDGSASGSRASPVPAASTPAGRQLRQRSQDDLDRGQDRNAGKAWRREPRVRRRNGDWVKKASKPHMASASREWQDPAVERWRSQSASSTSASPHQTV